MAGREAIDAERALDLEVDPIAEARAYQDMLLGVLGERDPAEVQAGLADQLQAVVE